MFASQRLVSPELSENHRLMQWAADAAPAGPGERRRTGGRIGRDWRRGHRALSHRAHVLRGDRDRDAGNDRPGDGGCKGAGQAAPMQRETSRPSSARWRAIGLHPAARSAAPRVPPKENKRSRVGQGPGRKPEDVAASVLALQGDQPDAGTPAASWDHLSRNQHDATRAIFQRRVPWRPQGRDLMPEVMIPLTPMSLSSANGRSSRGSGGQVFRRNGSPFLSARHHDRAARARPPRRNRPRAQFFPRNQRSPPDHLGLSLLTTRPLPALLRNKTSRTIRSVLTSAESVS